MQIKCCCLSCYCFFFFFFYCLLFFRVVILSQHIMLGSIQYFLFFFEHFFFQIQMHFKNYCICQKKKQTTTTRGMTLFPNSVNHFQKNIIQIRSEQLSKIIMNMWEEEKKIVRFMQWYGIRNFFFFLVKTFIIIFSSKKIGPFSTASVTYSICWRVNFFLCCSRFSKEICEKFFVVVTSVTMVENLNWENFCYFHRSSLGFNSFFFFLFVCSFSLSRFSYLSHWQYIII